MTDMTSSSDNQSNKKTFVIDDAGTMPSVKSGQSGYNELHIRSKTGGQTISFASSNKDALEVIRQLTDGNTDWQVDTQMSQQFGQSTTR